MSTFKEIPKFERCPLEQALPPSKPPSRVPFVANISSGA